MSELKKRTHLKTKNKPIIVNMPKTRDPFTNLPPKSLGFDDKGLERFWIPSSNQNIGATGVLFNEEGEYSLYHIGRESLSMRLIEQQDKRRIWITGGKSAISGARPAALLQLNLDTGKYTRHDVKGLMVLDTTTGRALCAEIVKEGVNKSCFLKTVDVKTGKTVKKHDKPIVGLNKRVAWRHKDGKWSVVTGAPGFSVMRWTPLTGAVDTVLTVQSAGKLPGFLNGPILDGQGRAFFGNLGWYNPATGKIDKKGPAPSQDSSWFKRCGHYVWGENMLGDDTRIVRWDLRTGDVKEICVVRDCHPCCVNVSESEKVIAVNHFGTFTRHDAHTGFLEKSKIFPVEEVGEMDCVIRLSKDLLLGTPFISQRFWEVNLKTGKGRDCGRAAPGVGEILTTNKIGGKLYMAAYTGGELMEYDWRKPARYPENPRPVAKSGRSMRPKTSVVHNRVLWYACNHPYGLLGSELTRFDTRTGEAQYGDNPIPDMQILGLQYLKKTDGLLCGTCIYSDGDKKEPSRTQAVFAEIDATTLKARRTMPAPDGCDLCYPAGSLGGDLYLAVMDFTGGRRRWAPLSAKTLALATGHELREIPSTSPPKYAGRPGYFVYVHEGRVELWDMRKVECAKVLFKIPKNWPRSYKCVARDNDMILLFPEKAVIVEKIFDRF